MTCAIVGCTKSARQRGWCAMHYHRWYRSGDPLGVVRLKVVFWRPCAACGTYFKPRRVRGMYVRHCSQRCAGATQAGVRSPVWRGDAASYSAVHVRLRSSRGPAGRHRCACGAVAAHWAYDHADPDERMSPSGPYSTDLAHYLAMCVSCHKLHDLQRRP